MVGIEVAGSRDEGPNRAFRPLAGYLNGANRSRRRIAMTASVPLRSSWPGAIGPETPVRSTVPRPLRFGSEVRFVMNRRQTARDAVSSRVGMPCRNWQVRGRHDWARIDGVPGVLERVQ